jgi:hypothetical protein
MRYATPLFASFVIAAGLQALHPRPARAQEPVLESYSISHGGSQALPSGVDAIISDRFFGNGTARARIQLDENDESSRLSMTVWRRVRQGEIVFALLVFRVEVRGLDASGMLVYSRDLMGFTFGDSSGDLWSRRLRDLPPGLAEIRVTFFGNYE